MTSMPALATGSGCQRTGQRSRSECEFPVWWAGYGCCSIVVGSPSIVLPATALTTSIGEQAFDEFHTDSSEPRAHYRPLWDAVRQMGPATLAAKAREAELALGADGVTFTVYGDDAEGVERTWPCDLIPRIVPAGEWARLAAGLAQRVRALELFLRDVHHGQRILKDGVVPADL